MSMPPSYPVIVVPGITATYLRDQYSLPPDVVWSVLKKKFKRVALHPDNLGYEATQPARVVSDKVFEIAYEELVEELQYNLRRREDDTVPVYTFGYDWRHPLVELESQLADFVEEVIDRTKLMRNYHPEFAENPKVNMVGHSMGGLLIAGYLQEYGGGGRVHKVTSLASPFQGSFEAVIKVATGTANLGTGAPSSREREAARVTPALYHLVPSFRNGLIVDDDLPNRLFDPGLWQPSILDTLEEYIRLHSVEKGNSTGRSDRAAELFSGMLFVAEQHRKRLDDFRLDGAGLQPDDWLCVVGVDATTRVKLQIEKKRGKPEFRFSSDDRQNEWHNPDDQDARRMTGDGTVPFEGAVPKFLQERNLVCLTPDDFGYWELGDKVTMKLGGFHGILPNMNVIHRLIVRHFTGAGDRRGNTWGRPAPGISGDDWSPPFSTLRNKSES